MTIKAALSNAWHAVKAVFTPRNIHTSMWFRGLTSSYQSPTYTAVAQRANQNPHASRGLRVIAQMMASIPLEVRVRGEVVEDHPLLTLLKRPNQRTTYRRFCDQVVQHMYCGGEMFIEMRSPVTGTNAGKPRELKVWRPDQFGDFIIAGDEPPGFMERLKPETRRLVEDGDVIGYRFTDKRGVERVRTIDEVAHPRVYNPTDHDRGMPILIGAHKALISMEEADDWNRNIAKGGGRVPGFWVPKGLQSDESLTKEQVEAAEKNLDVKTTERAKSNLGMVMSGSFEWQNNTVSPKDAEWLAGQEANMRKVATVLGLFPSLLGDVKSGSLTDAGVDSEVKAALVLTILPFLDFFLEELNAYLAPRYGDGVELAYSKADIEPLQEDRNTKYRRLVDACGGAFLTRDEAREEDDREPLKGEYAEILDRIGTSTPSQRAERMDRSPVTLGDDEDDNTAKLQRLIRRAA